MHSVNRRQFLQLAAASVVAAPAIELLGQSASASTAPQAQFDHFFLPILDGFLKNAAATAPDYVVCDFPDGTKLKSCCTPSGKTYVSVARMLPPIVEWVRAGRTPGRFDVAAAFFKKPSRIGRKK